MPERAITTCALGVPLCEPSPSTCLTTVSNPWTTRPGGNGSNVRSRQSIGFKLTENDVLAIEPGCLHSGDEELGPVGIRASIGHGQKTDLVVLPVKVLI